MYSVVLFIFCITNVSVTCNDNFQIDTQQCQSFQYSFKGKYFSNHRISSTGNVIQYEAPHIHGCIHLCNRKNGCLALDFEKKTSDDKNTCRIYTESFPIELVTEEINSTAVLFIPEFCEEEAIKGHIQTYELWSSLRNVACPNPCPIVDYKENRFCLDAMLNCGGMITCLNRLRKCDPGECRELNDLQSLNANGTFYFNISSRRVPLKIEMTSDGTQWIIIQQRSNGVVEFYRDWQSYKIGFGSLQTEFWLGNDNIHELTKNNDKSIRIEIFDESSLAFATYSSFMIGPEDDQYRLNISGYSGNATDCLIYHNHRQFSTKDNDNDRSDANCAKSFRGAWWYGHCKHSSLNGQYWKDGTRYHLGILWSKLYTWYHLFDGSIMKLRFKP